MLNLSLSNFGFLLFFITGFAVGLLVFDEFAKGVLNPHLFREIELISSLVYYFLSVWVVEFMSSNRRCESETVYHPQSYCLGTKKNFNIDAKLLENG
jgi:hypothetical protein